MVANADHELSSQSHDASNKSRFTYRDLRQLSQYSTDSPLRVIALVDFDCFYAQCERVRLGLPEGQPLGVQQFKYVIATNYEARAAGLKKVVSAVEAKRLCPNIILQHVPTWREGDDTWRYRDDAVDHMSEDKSSLDYYRLQSRRAIEVVKQTLPEGPSQKVEKASIDEIFVDLSVQVHEVLLQRYPELLTHDHEPLEVHLPKPWNDLLDWGDSKLIEGSEGTDDPETTDWDDVALHIGAEIVQTLRKEIYEKLHYTCSAGVARNKVVAKLAAGHNKPNKQTVIRNSTILPFLMGYKFTKLRGLGGKLGQQISKAFSTEQLSVLLDIPLKVLQNKLGTESGSWVYRVIRGIENSEVTPRTQIKSMLSAKTFDPGINNLDQAEKWLRIFAADIIGRLEDQQGRRPKTMSVHHHVNGRFGPTRSKQAQIPPSLKLDAQSLAKLFREVLSDIASDKEAWPCWTLSVGVADFIDAERSSHSISSMFALQKPVTPMSKASIEATLVKGEREEPVRPNKRTILDFKGFVESTPHDLSMGHAELGPELGPQEVISKKLRRLSDDNCDVLNEESTELGYRCPTCSDVIPPEIVLEHLDWHVAMNLQRET